MVSGDIDVGKNPPARKSAAVRPQHSDDRSDSPAPVRPHPGQEKSHCGAMSLQRSSTDAVSTPQKFLRLVGHREPRKRPPRGR
jgi:hypothetical protein